MELTHLSILATCQGQTLNSQQLSNVQIGCVKRHATENLVDVRFWGKIEGTSGDYLIVQGISSSNSSSAYPVKKFYFSTDGSPELQQFPNVSTEMRARATKYLDMALSGDPSSIREEGEPTGEEAGEEEAGEGENNQDNTLRESDVLVLVVERIDAVMSVVPAGAYVMTPTKHTVPNAQFQGLSWESANQLSNYFHLRQPEEKARQALLEGEGVVRPGDFLDPISNDMDGSWTIQCDNTSQTMMLRNWTYPGAFCFHSPKTTTYGSVYIGNGIQNQDLAFMI